MSSTAMGLSEILAAHGQAKPSGRISAESRRYVMAVAAISLVAVALRIWNLGAPFGSSDQAAMAYMVQHSFGLGWFFAHDYGPVLPIIQRAFAEFVELTRTGIDETTFRLPVMLISLAQVAITFSLARRLGSSRAEATIACLGCALLPTLVTDAHYAWGYLTVWLFTGSATLWATLSWLDTRRRRYLFAAAIGLFLHALSNTYSFGLPVLLLIVWLQALRERGSTAVPYKSALLGYVLPAVLALAVIWASWEWTGGGQIGRLLSKRNAGTAGFQWHQLAGLPSFWAAQFGYWFGIVAAAGLLWGLAMFRRRPTDRRSLLAIWAIVGGLPLVLLADWQRIGYPGSYFIETVYCAGLLGCMWLCRVHARFARVPAARPATVVVGLSALTCLGASTADDCLFGGSMARWTGVHTGWGVVHADDGSKSAGWYIRQHVPQDATIMVLHSNQGMELPVAEYYTGRKVLASYDLTPQMFALLVPAMENDIDILVVEADDCQWGENLPDFERVCTIRRNARPVRFIYARRELRLSRVDEEASVLNQRYHDLPLPNRVPLPLRNPRDFQAKLSHYTAVVAQLKQR